MNEWLIDEDAETLSATLSLVASWDTKGERRSISTTSSRDAAPEALAVRHALPVNSETETAKTKPKTEMTTDTVVTRHRRVNATRERRKEEIELLRNESSRLMSQLNALQQRRQELLRPHFSGNAITTTAPVWETIARRQFLSRKRSEAYHEKLRAQLAEQVRVAEELMNAIQVAMQRHSLQEQVRRPLAIDVSQRMSEEEQLQRLQFLLDQWQWMLSLSPKFQRGELQFSDFVVVESDSETATLDFYNSYVIPYAVDTVVDFVWAGFHEETSGFDEDEGDDVDKSVQENTVYGDLVVAVFRVDSTMGGATARQGTIRGKSVAKHTHLDGGGQRLIASHSQYELSGFGNELDGVSVSDDGLARFVDARDIGCTQFTEPVAVAQHMRRLRISFNRSDGVDEKHVKTVTDLLSQEMETELAYVQRSLEDALMAQSVRQKLQQPAYTQ